MAKQTILWTALPNGVRDGLLHLSVFVSPRLTVEAGDPGTLEPFEDWHDWPEREIAFQVSIGGAQGVAATPAGPPRRSDLWTKLFPTTTPVTSHTDAVALLADKVKIRSWPSNDVRDFVRQQYALVGALHAVDHPTHRDYGHGGGSGVAPRNGGPPPIRLADVHLTRERKQDAIAAIRTELATTGYFTGGELGDFSATEINFLLAEQFQNRSWTDNNVEEPPPPPPPKIGATQELDGLDFHTALGALGEYPALLRLLGLVRDITVPLPDPLPTSPTTVQLTADWQPVVATTPVYPTTRCELSATTFVPQAESALIGGGLYRLDQPDFSVVEIDPDAGAPKIAGLAKTIAEGNSSSDQQAPPSLSGTGLSLNQMSRAPVLHAALTKATALDAKVRAQARTHAVAADDLDISAEDITRGFRLDVWDDVTNAWHSVCLRKGTYVIGGVTVTADDEGTIVPAHTKQLDDNTFYLHESLARWVGYSLAASRPGSGIGNDGQPTGTDSEPGELFDLKSMFSAAPGTLPKLRYGRTYRLRARTADLAGNGLALGDLPADDFTAASSPVTYHRFEPVAAPFVLMRKPRTEGESAERLVIRGNYDAPATGHTERHVAPQRTSQLTAEQHGMLDVPKSPANPGGMDKSAYDLIAAKDPGSFAAGGTPDEGGHGVPYFDVDQLKLPYFPDVLGRGASFRGLPGTTDDEVVTVDFDYAFGKEWPDARPFRFRLVNGSGEPTFHPFGRVLTVNLPPGRVQDVRISSRIEADDRELLGLWAWLVEYVEDGGTLPSGVTLDMLRTWATEGRLWQLTPYRTLTLVHAIRQPLTPPAFSKPVAVRKVGETFARIVDKITLDRRSTSRLGLLAAWTDPVDRIDRPAPESADATAQAFEVQVNSAEAGSDVIAVNEAHEFHDTKYHKVSYTAVATTRFAEYFVERTTRTLSTDPDNPTVISTEGIVPGTDAVAANGDGTSARVTYVRGTHYNVDYADGTMVALVDNLPGNLEVAFVPPPVTRQSTEVEPVAVVNVPSSARPAAPDVAYLVPTFGWEQQSTATSIASTRLGNGLRVYLRRPWWSSGDGEQLGVVLLGEPLPPPGSERTKLLAKLERYVSVWGQDPAFASAAPANPPLRGDFPTAVHPKSGLVLAESDKDQSLTEKVAVAPYDVGFEADRQLWYADITVKPGFTYSPFLRLALARYQPISITGVELSTVVLAQFAQLAPDRALSVVFSSTDQTKLTVTVTGQTYTPMNGYADAASVHVLVQTANPALTGDLAWTTASQTPLAASDPVGTWSGTVTLPGARGTQPFRLVIQEHEKPSMGGSRLVYADAVQL
jgi:hypothetical protein